MQSSLPSHRQYWELLPTYRCISRKYCATLKKKCIICQNNAVILSHLTQTLLELVTTSKPTTDQSLKLVVVAFPFGTPDFFFSK